MGLRVSSPFFPLRAFPRAVASFAFGRGRIARPLVLLALVIVLIGVSGCSSGSVVAMPGRDTTGLTARDMVLILDRAGFDRGEIEDLAPRLRNDLARNGAAKIVQGDRTQAMFAISGGRVHISSLRRGSFVYDPSTQGYD